MSLQEAASSGSFNPSAAQPSNPPRAESPFDPPPLNAAVDQSVADSPFANPYDYAPTADDATTESGGPDLRATRRRAWTIIGLAIVVPMAVAAIIAWQLFGGEAEPAPTVTRIATTPAEQVADDVQVAAVATQPSASTASETSATPAEATASTATVAVTTASEDSAAAETTATAAAAVETSAAVDLSSLDPAARLAAWTDIQTVEVLPGETLWLLALNYDTTISAIVALNNLADPEMLSVGQLLMIPVGFAEEIVAEAAPAVESGSEAVETTDTSTVVSSAPLEAPTATDDLINWHTIAPVLVVDGDSLAAIAAANNTTVEALMALNGIADSELILAGTELLVPVGYPDGASVNSVAAGAPAASDEMMEEDGPAAADATDSMEE